MLLRSVRSEKSQREYELNVASSAEGRARRAAAEEIQSDVQGSLSDLVREHGALTDDQVLAWEEGLSESYSSVSVSVCNSYNRRRYVAVGGKWVATFDDLPDLPKPKCFRPLFGGG